MEFRFGTEVTNVRFEITDGKKTARAIECRTKTGDTEIPLTEKGPCVYHKRKLYRRHDLR